MNREASHLRLVQRWLYARLMKFPQGEAFARKWSRELRDTVRTRPKDVAKMRSDLRRNPQ